MKNGWGRDDPFARRVFTDAFLPESTPDQQRWFDDLQRVSCTPETALRLMKEVGNLNIEDLLPKLTVPTLVLHSKGDLVIPFERGREMAGRIPNSRFVPMEGRNHILLPGEPAWQRFLSETRSFTGIREPPDYSAETSETGEVAGLDRRLAAIMYTDIVGYTPPDRTRRVSRARSLGRTPEASATTLHQLQRERGEKPLGTCSSSSFRVDWRRSDALSESRPCFPGATRAFQEIGEFLSGWVSMSVMLNTDRGTCMVTLSTSLLE